MSSLGEYAALVVAQVLSLSDALMLVAHRARYMAERCPPGSSGMMAVGMNSTSVERTLGSSSAFDELVIACYNGPTDVVVSGPFDQLVAFKDHLHAESLCNCRLLSVPFAFHSPAMQPLLDDLDLAASRVSLRAPHIPICANVLGEVVMPGDESVFTNQYFSRHCVQPVLFERCVQSLRSTLPTIEAWVEIGPHTTSLSMLHKNAVSKDALLLGSLRKGQSAWTTLANSLAQLYCSDIHLSWRAVFSHLKSVRCVETPLYPFARTKFWVDYRDDLRTPTVVAVPQPEAEMPMPIPEYSMLHSCTQIPSSANANEALFETPIDAFISSIDGHKVGGVPLCPASVYLDQALCAIQSAIQYLGNVSQHMHIVLKDIGFAKPLVHNGTDRVMKTSITFSQRISGVFTVTSYVRGNSEEVVHVRGDFRVQATLRTTTKFLMTVPTLNQRITNILETIDGESPQTFASRTIYDVIFSRVVEYAKSYRAIMSLTVDHTSMNGVALVKLPDECDPGRFVVHPAYLDTLLHVAGFIANLQCDPGDVFICSDVGTVKIISGLIDRDQLYKMCCNSAWMPHGRGIVAEVYAMQKDEPHRIVAHMKGIHFRLVRLQNLSRSLKRDQHKLTDMHASDVIQAPSASVSPSLETDDIGAEVIKVVAETCNVSATTLSLNTNVQDLGLDSLMSIELSHKIRCTFPHVLSSSCHLMLCSTIADILQIVTSGPSSRSGASTPHTLVPDSEDGCGKTNAVLGDQVSVVQSKECLESPELSAGLTGANIAGPESGSPNGSRIPQPNDFLHRLQDSPTSSHTERSPLVLIHDGSGLINHYERLPPLYRTVFGIQNPHFITAQPWDSLVKMAAQYAQRISASLPKGGVLLGGTAYRTSAPSWLIAIRFLFQAGLSAVWSPSKLHASS
jgi:iterative type I PKS product template protein